jgi:Uma2 family endonuclease
MIATPQPQEMTVEAYLEWEPCQEIRYEFVNCKIFAMTGGTLPHNDIAVNLLTALRPQIRTRGCRINIADAKVNVAPSIYRYPDLVVSCDDRDRTARNAIQYPKLIIEVLSPGTESLDRGDKFREYRTLPSLEEYVLISSTQINVEIYRRGEGRLWLYTAYQSLDIITIESVGFEFPIALLYEDVVIDS